MPRLKKMIGETIYAVVPFLGGSKIHHLKLHEVEFGGIWVESEDATDSFFEKLGAQVSANTPVFFLPYSQITILLGFESIPSFSRKGLGLKS